LGLPLQDEKKDKEGFKGPSGFVPSGGSTPVQRNSEPDSSAFGSAASSQVGLENGLGSTLASDASDPSGAAGGTSSHLSRSPPSGVQAAVEVFREKIDAAAEKAAAEAATVATLGHPGRRTASKSWDVEGAHAGAAAAAAAVEKPAGEAGATGEVVEEQQQDVAALAAAFQTKVDGFVPLPLPETWSGAAAASAAAEGSEEAHEAATAAALSDLFQEFLSQLQEQGLYPAAASAQGSTAKAMSGSTLSVPQAVQLFNSFLLANKGVPVVHRLLSSRRREPEQQQQVPEQQDQQVTAAADVSHAEQQTDEVPAPPPPPPATKMLDAEQQTTPKAVAVAEVGQQAGPEVSHAGNQAQPEVAESGQQADAAPVEAAAAAAAAVAAPVEAAAAAATTAVVAAAAGKAVLPGSPEEAVAAPVLQESREIEPEGTMDRETVIKGEQLQL
jgi:hypothetical protein